MKLSNLEIFLLITQIVLIPTVHFFFQALKKDILNVCKEIIHEYYITLDNLIDSNKTKLEDYISHSIHKEALLKIYLKQLSYRISDIELYLSKNGYNLRHQDEDSEDISGFLNNNN